MPDATTRPDIFAFNSPLQSHLRRAAFDAAPLLRRGLGLARLSEIYEKARTLRAPSFAAAALQALDVRLSVAHADGGLIPARGPVIVAANHPTGALDGLVLAEVVRQVRADVRILTNHLLARIPELEDLCFFVDPFGSRASVGRSQSGLRAAHRWVRGGGALVIFPAGEVATGDAEPPTGTPSDPEWHLALGRLALTTGARIVPVFIAGRNSRAFYAAGLIHPWLRTALLGRELLNKQGSRVRLAIGPPLDHAMLRHAGEAAAVTALARATVARAARALAPPVSAPAVIAAPVDPTKLVRDVCALPIDSRVLASGPLEVYTAFAAQIPSVLQEIGRLREISFRAVGEGTGLTADLDRFDQHYDHLFVWNRKTREVVGAYRVGDTRRIVAAHGIDGLYTRTLFRYDHRLLDRIGPAFELGRSFVRPEYQRSYGALLLLWRGIGRILERSGYRVLFGPVSISSRYQDTSQQLLRAFLARHHGDPGIERLVFPVNPPSSFAAPARSAAVPTTVGELETLVKRLEGGGGIPVLLRQYLRLNATLLGFNVDPAFGDALDALMMVHVDRMPTSVRRQYLGANRPATAA
jgi:putative hemolysin